jgi:hypothetical protein
MGVRTIRVRDHTRSDDPLARRPRSSSAAAAVDAPLD